MYLLIQAVNTDSEQETRIFTFHNVSINSL